MLDRFRIGHKEDDECGTGVTVILADGGAVGGVSVRGGAPGTRETDLLKSENTVSELNAVVLAGGSAFGLESACGVMDYYREREIGYVSGNHHVPIVAACVLFDLDYIKFGYPTKEMGLAACESAKENNFRCGNIGAGKGATVGKIMGKECCDKGGLGVATLKCGELEVGAIVAVNAFGDIWDYKTNTILRGVKMNGAFMNTVDMMTASAKLTTQSSNTTIGCIFTNAKLTKPEANKLADTTHDAFALTIRPVHTSFDGDTIFAMASGEVACNTVLLQQLAVQAMAQAIMNACHKNDLTEWDCD